MSNLLVACWTIGVVFLLLGLAFSGAAISAARQRRRALTSWPRADATLVSWERHEFENSDAHFARYAFTAPGGQPIEGRAQTQSGADAPGATGTTHTVLVDPTDPSRFLLLDDDGGSWISAIGAAFVVIGLISLGAALSGVA